MVLIYCDQRRSTILNPVLGLVEIKVIVDISLSREESGNEIGMTSPVACNVALLLLYLFMYLFVCFCQSDKDGDGRGDACDLDRD